MADLAILTVRDIQAWLEATKVPVSTTDPDDLDILEALQKNKVYGRLTQKYNVSAWVSSAATPSLVKQVMAMGVAASIYRRYYSEDGASVNAWAEWLEEQAKCVVDELLSGATVLLDEVGIEDGQTTLGQPAFYPNDTSSVLDNTPAFTMGKVF